MNRLFSQPNLYLIFSLLCFLRVDIWGAGNIFSMGSFVMFYLLSIYYWFKVHFELSHTKIIGGIDLLLILYITYCIILMFSGTDYTWKYSITPRNYLEIILKSLLPIYAFYYFGRKGMINTKWFRHIAVLFFIGAYIHFQANLRLVLDKSFNDEVTNNAGYTFLAIIPLMAFFRGKPLIQYLGLAVIFFFIITGMKRGAILIGSIATIPFIWGSMKGSRVAHKIVILFLSAILLLFITILVKDMYANSDYFYGRVMQTMDGDSSQRDIIWKNYIAFFFTQDNPIHLLIGNGAGGGLHYLGVSAHNDWLDILVEMGLAGIIVYMIFWKRLLNAYNTSKIYCQEEITMVIGLFCLIYFTRSFFSQSITDLPLYSTSVLGFCLGVCENAKSNGIEAIDIENNNLL